MLLLSKLSSHTAAIFVIIFITALDVILSVLKSERHVVLGELIHTLNRQTDNGSVTSSNASGTFNNDSIRYKRRDVYD